MPTLEKAVHLLHPGDTAFAILTNGLYLSLEENGNGTSGYWSLDAKRASKAQKVIIYKRSNDIKSAPNDVYIADFVRLTEAEPIEYAGRFLIHLTDIKFAGHTDKGWQEFVGPGQRPTRYLEG